jgi:hypothetical protein
VAVETYPESTLDDAEALLGLLGSFWQTTYKGQADVRSAVKARGDLAAQVMDRLQEAADSRGRLSCPVYRRERWRYAPLLASGLNADPPTYGSGGVHGQTGWAYGTAVDADWSVYPAPAGLAECRLITNRLEAPSAVLFEGLDFVLDADAGRLAFRSDPFADDRFARTETDDDAELALWLYRPGFDRRYVYEHFGHILGLPHRRGEAYKDLVNRLYDMIVLGSSGGRLMDALAACAGVPLASADGTVEVVEEDASHLLVVTDSAVHRYSAGSTALVAAGDEVLAGDPLTDGLTLHEFHRGEKPDGLAGLGLGPGMLTVEGAGELGFPDRDVPLELEYDTDGLARVSFELGGHPLLAEAFWDEVHRRGVEAGTTLASLMDTRESPADEPTAQYLPATVNPLGFLAENVLRHGCFLVRVKVGAVGPEAAGLRFVGAAARLVQPDTKMFLLIEADGLEESRTPEEDWEGDLDSLPAAEPLEEELGEFSVDHVIVARSVSGSCQ